MTKDELIIKTGQNPQLASKALSYMLHVGTNQINDSNRADMELALSMAGQSADDRKEMLDIFDMAKDIAALPPKELMDYFAFAFGKERQAHTSKKE